MKKALVAILIVALGAIAAGCSTDSRTPAEKFVDDLTTPSSETGVTVALADWVAGDPGYAIAVAQEICRVEQIEGEMGGLLWAIQEFGTASYESELWAHAKHFFCPDA